MQPRTAKNDGNYTIIQHMFPSAGMGIPQKFLGVNMEDTNQSLDMFGATCPVFSSRNP